MLKPDVGRQQLETLKSSKHAEARWVRIRQLPEALAGAAFGLYGRLPNGDYPKDWNKRRELQQAAIPKLADAKARAKIFAALYPTIAGASERRAAPDCTQTGNRDTWNRSTA